MAGTQVLSFAGLNAFLTKGGDCHVDRVGDWIGVDIVRQQITAFSLKSVQ